MALYKEEEEVEEEEDEEEEVNFSMVPNFQNLEISLVMIVSPAGSHIICKHSLILPFQPSILFPIKRKGKEN